MNYICCCVPVCTFLLNSTCANDAHATRDLLATNRYSVIKGTVRTGQKALSVDKAP